MKKLPSKKSLLDGYQVAGFRTNSRVKGRFGDRPAVVIKLSRRRKKRHAADVVPCTGVSTIDVPGRRGISALEVDGCILNLNSVALIARFAAR